jgi:uncharacterized protein with HEPN domain
MDDTIKTWFYDILSSIHEIESYFIETPKRFEIYQNDLRTKRAVERNIEIIGEAMSRILKENSEIEISNSRKMVDVRNRIIHGYDSVSDDVIWGIVIRNLPVLQNEVEIYPIADMQSVPSPIGKQQAPTPQSKSTFFNLAINHY